MSCSDKAMSCIYDEHLFCLANESRNISTKGSPSIFSLCIFHCVYLYSSTNFARDKKAVRV